MQEKEIQAIIDQCPFMVDGQVKFKYRPLRDVVFLWPVPAPTTLGTKSLIVIPEDQRYLHRPGLGVLLAVGPGWYGRDPRIRQNGRWVDPGPKEHWHPVTDQLRPGRIIQYNRDVPWYHFAETPDGTKKFVVMCSTSDIYGVYE